MTFEVSANAYDRFMGQFSEPLAVEFAAVADLDAGDRVLDVGCGPGALTGQLVRRVGVAGVSAVDPSASFVDAAAKRFPGIDVQRGVAESLPFADDTFDAALAQLVVHFMQDPVAGLREMARVTRPDGVVAACTWDFADGGGPLSIFWRAAQEVGPPTEGESARPGTREGHLAELATEAGLADIESGSVAVTVPFATFGQWWEPYTLGVGPVGAYVGSLDEEQRAAVADACRRMLPPEPFEVTAMAWTLRARPAAG